MHLVTIPVINYTTFACIIMTPLGVRLKANVCKVLSSIYTNYLYKCFCTYKKQNNLRKKERKKLMRDGK